MVGGVGLAGAAWLLAGVTVGRGRRLGRGAGGEGEEEEEEEEEEEGEEEGYERIGVVAKGWAEVTMPREDEFLMVGHCQAR